MKKTIIAGLLLSVLLPAVEALAGNCTNPWDTASDGSRCGARSSSSRPGGK
jgi:hypothetical protein